MLNLKGRKVRWSDVAQLILDACVDRDMGEVTSPEIECEVWIDMYLHDRPILEDPDDAAAERLPLLYESRIHINLNDLSQLCSRECRAVLHRLDSRSSFGIG